jgi:hypothetical protein
MMRRRRLRIRHEAEEDEEFEILSLGCPERQAVATAEN